MSSENADGGLFMNVLELESSILGLIGFLAIRWCHHLYKDAFVGESCVWPVWALVKMLLLHLNNGDCLHRSIVHCLIEKIADMKLSSWLNQPKLQR